MKIKMFFSLWAMFCISISSVHSKPGVPVSINIEALDAVIAGSSVSFVVTAMSKVNAEVMQINVQVPTSMQVVSGELSWRGKVSAHQKVDLNFTLVLPKNAGSLNAVAIIKGQKSASFMARATYPYGKTTKLKQQKMQSQHIIRNGQKIVEFPAKINK